MDGKVVVKVLVISSIKYVNCRRTILLQYTMHPQLQSLEEVAYLIPLNRSSKIQLDEPCTLQYNHLW